MDFDAAILCIPYPCVISPQEVNRSSYIHPSFFLV